MRSTRSKKIQSKASTDENKFKSVLSAKTKIPSTRVTRQHLRIITNQTTDSDPVNKLEKKSNAGGKMRTLARDEAEAQTVAMEDTKTDGGKRKCNDVDETKSTPLKKLKETETMNATEVLAPKGTASLETVEEVTKTGNEFQGNGNDTEKLNEWQKTVDSNENSINANDNQPFSSETNTTVTIELPNKLNDEINDQLLNTYIEDEQDMTSTPMAGEKQNTFIAEADEQPKISNAASDEQPNTSNANVDEQTNTSNANADEKTNTSNANADEQPNTSNADLDEQSMTEAKEQPQSSNMETDELSNSSKNEQPKTLNAETYKQPQSSNMETNELPNEQPKTPNAEADTQLKISNTVTHLLQKDSNAKTDEQPNSFNADQSNTETDKQPNTTNKETDEQPSTSKAALAQLASAAQFKSLRRLRSNPSLAETNNDETIVNGDLNTKPLPRRSSASLPDKLLSVISNLYLNAAERLKLDFPPRCAEDLEHCHQQHYRAPLPMSPNHTQANNLRCALQQQRYVSFVSWSLDMCHRGEFPGEGIFTKIIEIVLSFNSKSSTKTIINTSLGHFFNKSIELFFLIVRKFPPCWLTLRQFYINFFQTPLDASKLSKKNEPTLKSNNILEILLDLLENNLEKCTEDDLQKDSESFELPPNKIPAAAAAATPTKNPEEVSPQILSQQTPSQDMGDIANSECLNIWDWEEHESRLQTFEALQSPIIRLERLFIALELLLHILESDFVMWILHHHKKAKDWIFCEKNRPLIVLVLTLSKYSRSTGVVKHLFTLFSIGVNKRAKPRYLRILERYISLAVVASNVADLEYSAIGVRYPNLGTETKSLIHEFFVTFKAHNTSHVSSYLNTIEILRIPYVRFEFIDYFLQLFYFPRNEDMSPKKIAFDISKKRWLKYKPQVELNANDEDLSREQYLELLLTALKAYCEWHGAMNFFQLLTKDKTMSSFKVVTDSVHRWPTKGSGILMLNRMRKDIAKLEQQLRMTVRVSRPKIELPEADICIDQDVVLKYRTDLKFVVILNTIIAKQSEEAKDVDFTAWKTFLANFTEN